MANNNGFVVRVPKVASQSKDAQLYGTLKDLINRTNEQFAGVASSADLLALAEVVTALTASQIAFVPVGGIAATDVQSAIAELDSEKIGGSGNVNFLPVFSATRTLASSPFYTDGTRIGLGLAGTLDSPLNIATQTADCRIRLDGYGGQAALRARRANGTYAAPTAALVGQSMMNIHAIPYGTTGFGSSRKASIAMWAAENCTDTAMGTYITFDTTPIGSLTIAEAGRFTPSGDLSLVNDAIIGKSVLGSRNKTLTESVATGFVTVTIGAGAAFAGECLYGVYASDGTDIQMRTGRLRVVAVNKAGTVTVSINDIGSQEIAVSAGTLTAALTTTTGSGTFTLLANATSSLTQSVLLIAYRLDILGSSATVTGL